MGSFQILAVKGIVASNVICCRTAQYTAVGLKKIEVLLLLLLFGFQCFPTHKCDLNDMDPTF